MQRDCLAFIYESMAVSLCLLQRFNYKWHIIITSKVAVKSWQRKPFNNSDVLIDV